MTMNQGANADVRMEEFIVRDGVVLRWMDAAEFLERVSQWELAQDRQLKHHDNFRRMMEQAP